MPTIRKTSENGQPRDGKNLFLRTVKAIKRLQLGIKRLLPYEVKTRLLSKNELMRGCKKMLYGTISARRKSPSQRLGKVGPRTQLQIRKPLAGNVEKTKDPPGTLKGGSLIKFRGITSIKDSAGRVFHR